MVYVVLKDATNVPATITQLLKALTVVPTLPADFKVFKGGVSILRCSENPSLLGCVHPVPTGYPRSSSRTLAPLVLLASAGFPPLNTTIAFFRYNPTTDVIPPKKCDGVLIISQSLSPRKHGPSLVVCYVLK